MHIAEVIYGEMMKGNFSFLILVIGIVQVALMMRVSKKENEIKREFEKMEKDNDKKE